MSDSDKDWVFTLGLPALVMVAMSAYAGYTTGSSEADVPQSRWRQIEAPMAGLECWETLVSQGTGQRHVECWLTATSGGE